MTLQPHDLGLILAVKAQPGSRQNAIRGWHDGELCVAVNQIAEKGKANKAIIDFLSKILGLRRSQLEILSGETSSHKKILVTGVSVPELSARIASLLEAS